MCNFKIVNLIPVTSGKRNKDRKLKTGKIGTGIGKLHIRNPISYVTLFHTSIQWVPSWTRKSKKCTKKINE